MKQIRLIEALGHLALWQGMWLWLVWSAGRSAATLPSLVAVALLAAACWRAGSAWWRVLAVIATGLACGLAVDGSLLKTSAVSYAGGDPTLGLPPPWILALWALFAAAVALPMRSWLTNPIVAGVLGAVGGPLAYAGGRALGAIQTGQTGLVLTGIFYALATPVIVLLANRLLPAREAA